MSEQDLRISVELWGRCPELQAIGAIVQILEAPFWEHPHGGLRQLKLDEKARIARYIAERYAL